MKLIRAASLMFRTAHSLKAKPNIRIFGTKVFSERRLATYDERLDFLFSRGPSLMEALNKEAWLHFRQDLAVLVSAQPTFERRLAH